MKKTSKLATVFTLIAASSAAMGEDSTWKSQAELGIVNTSGNSKTSTINAKIDATNEKESWRHNLHSEVLKTSSASIIRANINVYLEKKHRFTTLKCQ